MIGNRVFISYCQKDKRWLEKLLVHLAPLEREGKIISWSDQKLKAGMFWRQSIFDAIDNADFVILLVSPYFLSSEFIMGNELPRVFNWLHKKTIRVLPVVISPCRYQYDNFLSKYQSVNSPTRPLSKMRPAEIDEVFVKVSLEISGSESRSSASYSNNSYYNKKEKSQSTNESSKPIRDSQVGTTFIEEVFPGIINKIPKAKRSSNAITFMDIDNLTQINKHFGEQVGDEVISTIGEIIRKRSVFKFTGRCGDDTFFGVSYNVSESKAKITCETLNKSIEKYSWHLIAKDLRVTCTFGYSIYGNDEDTYSWFTRSIYGMLEGKKLGGNKVIKGPLYLKEADILSLRKELDLSKLKETKQQQTKQEKSVGKFSLRSFFS